MRIIIIIAEKAAVEHVKGQLNEDEEQGDNFCFTSN